MLAAAANTTGNGLATGAYEVIKNPKVYAKLTAELKAAFLPNAKMELIVLERLLYLNGVVNESLRLSFGAISRLPRTVPKGSAKFEGYTIPVGFTVSGSCIGTKSIFLTLREFIPEQWVLTSDKQKMWSVCRLGKGAGYMLGCRKSTAPILGTYSGWFRSKANFRPGKNTTKKQQASSHSSQDTL